MFGLIKKMFGGPVTKTRDELMAMDPSDRYTYMVFESVNGTYTDAEIDAAGVEAGIADAEKATKPHITAAEVAAKIRETVPLTPEQIADKVLEAIIAADPIFSATQTPLYYRTLFASYSLGNEIQKYITEMDDQQLVSVCRVAHARLVDINAHEAWRREFQEGVDRAADRCRAERAVQDQADADKRAADRRVEQAREAGRAQGQVEGAVAAGAAAYLWGSRK